MSLPSILTESNHYVGLCDQLNGRVILRDLAIPDWSDDRSVVWEHRRDDQGRENFRWIAGLKFRHSDLYGGDVAIYCAPRCKAHIISMETRQELLMAEQTGCNPHATELLPNGVLVVGSSNDGLVTLYAPKQTTPCYSLQIIGSDSGAPDVHGILWDPKYQLLWIEGGQKLRSFRVEGTETAPTLTQTGEYTAPTTDLHDMAASYGDPDSLLLSGIGGIVRFDKRTKQFSYDFPHCGVAESFGCNTGFGLFADGVLALTSTIKSPPTYQYWNTDKIFVCVPTDQGGTEILTYHAPNDADYKLRVFDTNYQ